MGEGGEKEKRRQNNKRSGREDAPVVTATGRYSGKYSSLPPLNNSYREILHETRGFDSVPAPVTH